MFLEVRCSCEACGRLGVSQSSFLFASMLLTILSLSTPVALQYEKFYIPDAIRILDAIVDTLTF